MDRATSLVRRILAFLAASCVLLAVVVLRPSLSASVRSNGEFPAAFPEFEPAKARSIDIERTVKKDGKTTQESIRLVSGGAEVWSLESSHGYPAKRDRVKSFLETIRGTRTKSEPTRNPTKFAQFAGEDGYTEVRVKGVGGATLVSFGIGKSGAEGVWSDVYLRIDAPASSGRVAVARGFDSSGSRTEASAWVDTRIFPLLSAPQVAEIDLVQPAKSRTITLVRGTKGEKEADDPWEMKSPQTGKAVATNVMGLVRAFVGLNLGDVVDAATGAEADAKYGFDKPDVVAIVRGHAPKEELEGASWQLTIGKKAEGKDIDRWYVRRSVGGKEEPFVFTVSDWELRDFRGEPSQWLEKPPEPPPAEPGMAEPSMEPSMEPAMAPEVPGMGAVPAGPPAPPVVPDGGMK